MARSSQLMVALVVAVGLAAPSVAAAQRTAPPGSTSSGSAEPRGGGSSGGGGGGSAAPASSGGSQSGGGGSMGTAAPRGSANPGQGAPARDRNGRPIVGSASARPFGTVTGMPGPTFGPWGRYFPWYSTGFGWNSGFYSFAPYGYGYGSIYGYGPWYDPFFYDPFNPFGYGYGLSYGAYDPNYYGNGYGYSPYGSGSSSSSQPTHLTGSIRLKVSPDTAKVYIDGVLAGTANEFDGLVSHHLTLEGGTHQLELRADGYETYHDTITVDVGKTMTQRVSMKKGK